MLWLRFFDAMHGSEAEVRLDSHQLAGRLASFLWSSVPDDELLGLAAHERFIPPAALATQLERMRRSPKIRAFAESFISEWLDYSGLGGNIMPNLGRYPEFSRALAGDMKLEVERFFEHLLREDRSLLELLDSKYLVVNERLANFYGHPQPQPGGDFSVLERHSDHLGGLLGMSALMTVTSTPTRTSPVKRGVWLLEKVLGERLPPAPANVPELPPGTGEEGGLSVRQELAKHREQKTCAACHDRIDDFGFVLENFDAIGRWRASVGGQPVDSTVRLGNGKTYAGVSEFKSYLIEERSHDFIRNLTERMLSYALGRPLEYFDTPVVETISQRVIENGFRPSVMIGEIAKSYPFTWQRIQPQP